MIRVCFVDHSISGVVGGSLTGVYHLVRALDREHVEPMVLLYEPKAIAADFEAAGCRVLTLPRIPKPGAPSPLGKVVPRRGPLRDNVRALYLLGGRIRRLARSLQSIFARERVELVHLCNSIKSNLDGVLAARALGIPCVVHEKGLVSYSAVERWVARRVDACICMSEAIRGHLDAQGVRPRRVEVIYDGIDPADFRPRGDVHAVRRELGGEGVSCLVGITANIQPWKGQEVFVRALQEVVREVPGVAGAVVGGVACGHDEYRRRLEELATRDGLAGRVRFTGHRADMPDVVAALDVLVHASIQPEPFGRVLIEAMSLGKPVVATGAGGVPEIVEDGVTGLLVPPGDVKAMARAISRLAADPGLRVRLGRAGRERVSTRFAISAQARATEALYTKLVRGRRWAA